MSRTRPPKAVRSILYIHWKLRYYPSNNPMNYLATNVTKKLDHNKIRRLFRENLKHVYITSSVKHLTEVTHEDAGKANGLKFICDMLGIMAEETVSCGNGDNDIDMMKFTALGAAVSNASENCLAAADLIIGSSNDGGVAKFINDICDGKYD